MDLETKLDNEVQEAISCYKKICFDINELTNTQSKYFGEKTKTELVGLLNKINKITENEEKVKKEYQLYQKLRYYFAGYIGFIVLKELGIRDKFKKIELGEDFYTAIGNIIINDNT